MSQETHCSGVWLLNSLVATGLQQLKWNRYFNTWVGYHNKLSQCYYYVIDLAILCEVRAYCTLLTKNYFFIFSTTHLNCLKFSPQTGPNDMAHAPLSHCWPVDPEFPDKNKFPIYCVQHLAALCTQSCRHCFCTQSFTMRFQSDMRWHVRAQALPWRVRLTANVCVNDQ